MLVQGLELARVLGGKDLRGEPGRARHYRAVGVVRGGQLLRGPSWLAPEGGVEVVEDPDLGLGDGVDAAPFGVPPEGRLDPPGGVVGVGVAVGANQVFFGDQGEVDDLAPLVAALSGPGACLLVGRDEAVTDGKGQFAHSVLALPHGERGLARALGNEVKHEKNQKRAYC